MLMNLEGVALAADGAVTLIDMAGDHMVVRLSQSGVKKVFLLEEEGPIGVMIYNGAQFGGLPWKTVFETYRTFAAPPATVPDAVRGLRDFLSVSGSVMDPNKRLPVSKDTDLANLVHFIDATVMHYTSILERHAAAVEELGVKDLPGLHQDGLEQLALEVSRDFEYLGDQAILREGAPERAKVGAPTRAFEQLLASYLEPLLKEILTRRLGKASGGADVLKRLHGIVETALVTDWIPPGAVYTGLVITGFGRDEVSPGFVNLEVLGSIGGVLKHRVVDAYRTTGDRPSSVESFAMNGPVQAFLDGARPEFRLHAYSATVEELIQRLKPVMERVARKDPALAAEVEDDLVEAIFEAPARGLGNAVRAHWDNVSSNLVLSVRSLPASGLGENAARLLRLAVLEHELTGNRTVSKPITILEMSKGRHRFIDDPQL
jgi:hypothetical protein